MLKNEKLSANINVECMKKYYKWMHIVHKITWSHQPRPLPPSSPCALFKSSWVDHGKTPNHKTKGLFCNAECDKKTKQNDLQQITTQGV